MEKFSVEFSKEEIQKIERFRLENETLESTIKRLAISYIPRISTSIWTNNINDIFDEFDSTFQKLAE